MEHWRTGDQAAMLMTRQSQLFEEGSACHSEPKHELSGDLAETIASRNQKSTQTETTKAIAISSGWSIRVCLCSENGDIV